MEKFLVDLIDRISTENKPGHGSEAQPSWHALREAEKLTNKNFIDQLKSFVSQEDDKKKRNAAYFIIGKIAKNINCTESGAFLISRINYEKDKYIISSLLDRVADLPKPIGTDLEPIANSTKSKEWLVRQSAIRALNNSADPQVENILIGILENSKENQELIYANAALNGIGTKKSLPYLERMLKSRNQDVKGTAKSAIEKINERGS